MKIPVLTISLLVCALALPAAAVEGPMAATPATMPSLASVRLLDGPFAEAKEHLAGFYLLDVASEERAVEIAAGVPEAALGLVEVRPARSLDLAEW